jgi:hypothetical protein
VRIEIRGLRLDKFLEERRRIMRIIKIFVIMAGLLPIAVLPTMAAEKATAEPYTVATSEEVKAMIDRQEPDLVVIDARTPEEYD